MTTNQIRASSSSSSFSARALAEEALAGQPNDLRRQPIHSKPAAQKPTTTSLGLDAAGDGKQDGDGDGEAQQQQQGQQGQQSQEQSQEQQEGEERNAGGKWDGLLGVKK